MINAIQRGRVIDLTLHEFLLKCSRDDYVGIWDISGDHAKQNKSRKYFEKQPTPQNYFKIGNIPYGRIMYYLNMEILHINHTDKGFLVRLHNPEKTRKSLDSYDLASKIAKAIKREGI